jgi:type II secretory pathway pseudopilin PulG
MVPTRRIRGFTILEILIAVVVISVGLIGVLALLGQSLKRSGKTVEEGFAMTLGRSVLAALRDGSRERAFMVDDASGKTVKGFVWMHVGIETVDPNPPPPPPSQASDLTKVRKSDYVVFLPPKKSPDPFFVFPRPAADPTSENTSDADDYDGSVPAGGTIRNDFKITRVFRVPPPDGLETRVPADNSVQYGFAIAIQRAKTPNVLDPTDKPLDFAFTSPGPTLGNIDTSVFPPKLPADTSFQDGLYSIEVMIFRNFEANASAPSHQPIQRYRGLLALGQ